MQKEERGKPKTKSIIEFSLIHLAPLLAIWTGATAFDWALCVFLYFFRMFFITAGYHRYFAHNTYSTSRVFQFLLAFFAQTSVQKGALWWAAGHRDHHRYSDTPKDPHSKKIYGFLYSHIGWIAGPDYKATKIDNIKDFAKYKELLWLNKFHLIPPLFLMISVFVIGGFVNSTAEISFVQGGLSALLIGFFLSTAVLFHGTFSINSLMHMFGSKRYDSGDESRNNFFLAILTMGEGWHNNHHYYQSTARQGFFWWEFDPSFYIIKTLSFVGIVWDVKPVPNHIKYSKNLEDAKRIKLEESKKERVEELV